MVTQEVVELTIEEKIRLTFPEQPELMIAIAKAESGLGKNNYNPEWHRDRNGNPVCQGSFGLFQVGCVNYIEDPTKLNDVDFNLKIARKVYDTQGITAWGAYTNGSYKKYLV